MSGTSARATVLHEVYGDGQQKPVPKTKSNEDSLLGGSHLSSQNQLSDPPFFSILVHSAPCLG